MRNITIAILAVLLVSCSGPKKLQSNLQKLNSSIEYLHNSPTSSCPRSNQVYININNAPLDTFTTASKLSGLVLPFIIFNHFETTMKVKLGQSSIQENYNDFFTGSLIDESKRSGCFNVSKIKTTDSIYTLDLTIDTCNTISKYKKSYTFMYLFFAYSWYYSESGSPAQTNLQVSAKFRKGNSLIYDKKYSIKRIQPFVNPINANSNKLQSDFSTNMVEGLSLSTKDCIEQIVADINTSLYGSARPVIEVDNAPETTNQPQEVIAPTAKEEQTVEPEQATASKVEVNKNQFNIGENVKFYNYGFNDYTKGVVKEIKDKTIVVEYVSFGKTKTQEVSKSDIKRL